MGNQTKGVGHSIYRRGADDGFAFGIYLSVLFVVMAFSISSPLAGIASFGMSIAIPFIIYFYLRRGYRADNCMSTFSGIWLHGICIFFFASLLMTLTAYVYLRFIDPGCINNHVEIAKEVYMEMGTPEAEKFANLLAEAQATHALPTPGAFAIACLWASVFFGSLLSMVEALILRLTSRRRPPEPPRF